MNIVTVADGFGWSCEALIQLGHAVQKIAGRRDKTLGKLQRIASDLSQCRDRRPEYNTILLARPIVAPERFPSLEAQRRTVIALLTHIVTAVEREMVAAHRDSTSLRPRGRSSDECLAWGMEDSPFIAGVSDAINRIEAIDISREVDDAFCAAIRP